MPTIRGAVTRSRPIPGPTMGAGHLKVVQNPSGSVTESDGTAVHAPVGTQITVSEGHPWPRNKGQSDVGGDFSTIKTWVEGNPGRCVCGKSVRIFPDVPSITRDSFYNGWIWPLNPATAGISLPPSIPSSNDKLDMLGATAVARCKPTNSVADLSTFLGETLKDGIPRLLGAQTWKDKVSVGRKAGGEYLNVQFGWVPLVNDIRNLSNAISHAETVIKQYERDSGRNVRRRYNFPSEESITTTVIAENASPFMTPSSTDIASLFSGRVVMERVRSVERWFSGCFTYHLPSGYDSRNAMARQALEAKKLLGAQLTPETLWNLTPWSWAVDWFSNAGDVISNVTDWATDGLVMRYGYMMEHTIITDTYTYTADGSKPDPCHVPALRFISEMKTRRKANPFGFGISWDGLSPFQLAITLALGLSRS